MATARCYTKSGSIEKYESNEWSSPTSENWSSMGIVGTITTPDFNGNYTVTPASNYTDSNETTTYYCFTVYGGNKKIFYFKKIDTTITINIIINVFGYQSYNGNLVFNCDVLSNADKDATNILKNNSIILSYGVVNNRGPVGNYSVRVKLGPILLDTGINYNMDERYYIDMGRAPSVNLSSGTYNGRNWEISVHSVS